MNATLKDSSLVLTIVIDVCVIKEQISAGYHIVPSSFIQLLFVSSYTTYLFIS